MKRALILPIIILLNLWTLFLVIVSGCGEEKNPYPDKQRSSQTIGTGSVAPSKETGVDGAPAVNKTFTNINYRETDPFNQFCTKVATVKTNGNISAEIAVLCKNGKATAKMVEYAKSAYQGNGPVGSVPLVKLVSSGSVTELISGGAIKLPLSYAEVEAKVKMGAAVSVSTPNGVTITNTVTSTMPAVDQTYRECHVFRQLVETTVLFITMRDTVIGKECLVRLDQNPSFGLVYRVLVPGEADNQDNTVNSQLSFIVQTEANVTYAFSLFHMNVDNMGMAAIAEAKVRSLPAAFTRAYYNFFMGQ